MQRVTNNAPDLFLTLGACTRSTVVILCVHVSFVTVLAATCMYLVYEPQVRFYTVPYGISNIHYVGVAKNVLFSSFGVICLQPLGFHAL